jgi:DNA-binding NarL/FixJ family response regulator
MKILVIDDHPLIVDASCNSCRSSTRADHPVRRRSGEATEVLDNEPEIALVLLDLALPGARGSTFSPISSSTIRRAIACFPRRTIRPRAGCARRGRQGFIPKSAKPSASRCGAARLDGGVYLPADAPRCRAATACTSSTARSVSRRGRPTC